MLFSQLLGAMLMMTGMVQVHDAVSTSQDAFTACLRRFVTSSGEAHKSVEEFNTQLAQQCAQQEQAYRAAMIRRDTASHIRAAEAEQSANEEVEYARQNARETYANAQPR
jgi:hypothetical protein